MVGSLLSLQESQYLDKNRVQNSAQSELQISRNIKNGERAESGTQKQRDKSNLRGDLAPPTPWRPWTRGETLLPSREKVKEEEEEGGSLPLSPGGTRMPSGPSPQQRFTPRTSPLSSPTLPPSMQWCNPSFTRCNLYLNMVLNAIYYFPMMYGCPMMFE